VRLVAPDVIHGPALLAGGMESAQGSAHTLTYRMEAPAVPDEQRLRAALSSQPRPQR
jgi:hypothetical protein